MVSSQTQSEAPLWTDRQEMAPDHPTVVELSRLVRRGFALGKFKLPVLPEISMKLLEISKEDDVSIKDLAKLIEQDMVLAAEIVRLMRTPVYNRGFEIASIEQAVQRLGIGMLRDVVAQVTLASNVFSNEAYDSLMENLRRHCAATAQLATMVCRAADINYEKAFLAGLFHDIGLATPLLLIATAYPDSPPPLEEAWGEFVMLHEQISWHMARYWRIPDELRLVIRYHHQIPDNAPDAIGSSIVCVADRLSIDCGLSHTPSDFKPVIPEDPESGFTSQENLTLARENLGLSEGDYDGLLTKAADLIEQIE